MRQLLYFHLRVVCVLGVLALPANNNGNKLNPGHRLVNNKNFDWLSSRRSIGLMTERTQLSKVMRRVMLHIFKFHDGRIQMSELIQSNNQSVGDGSNRVYKNEKHGGQNEIDHIHFFVERSEEQTSDRTLEINHFETRREREKTIGSESIQTKLQQSDLQSDDESNLNLKVTVQSKAVDSSFPGEMAITTSSSSTDTEIKDTSDDMFLGSTSTCDHVTGYYKHRWLRLVVMCPSVWTNETARSQCEAWDEDVHGLGYIDEITRLPVQDSLGTVYGNAFCAICHNAYPVYPWKTVLQCHAPTDYNETSVLFTNISELNLSFLQSFHDNSFCKRVVVPSLPGFIERCGNHHPLWPKETYFRSNPLESLGISSSFPVNFNVLMNFDFTGETHILFSAGQQVVQNEYVRRCNVGETFDTYNKRCRPVRCGASHRLENGKCVPSGDSSNGETVSDDFDVSALHETVKVSLSVNISFGLYLIFKEQDDLNTIVAEQIADNLNISVDRIKHINVTFDFGSINKTGYQVQKLSLEKYKEYFPNDADYSKPASIIDALGDKDSMDEPPSKRRQKRGIFGDSGDEGNVSKGSLHVLESTNTQSPSSDGSDSNHNVVVFPDSVLGKTPRVPTYKNTWWQRSKSPTWKSFLQELIPNKMKTFLKPMLCPQNKRIKIAGGSRKENLDKHYVIPKTRGKRTNERKVSPIFESSKEPTPSKKHQKTYTTHKPNQWQKIQELSSNHVHPNTTSNWDTLWSLLQPLGDHGQRTNQSDFVPETPQEYDSKNNHQNKNSSNTESRIYLSPPLNEENDRMLLGANSDIDFDEPMAMRISFILVPPDDPGSDEEQAMSLLKKIADLITDREFTLLVSGNEVSVVNSDNPEEDEEKANQFCPWGVMFIAYDDEFSILEIDNITMLYINKTKTYHGIGRFDLWVMVKGKNSAYETSVTNLKEYAFVCFMPRILQEDCQRITLTPNEYKVMSADNRSILFEENEYNITTYSVLNETSGEIQICVPQSYDPDIGQIFPHYYSINKGCGSGFDDVRRAEGYLTLILGRVSIAAQALVLFTYFLFPSLRNLPGCNIMSLTLALFIAETIFEEGMLATTQWRCVTVAITLHFFFLASHFWMNVMSFDVYRAFSKPNVSTTGKSDKQIYFPKYFMYAWGMPAVIVGICSFVEFSDLFTNVEIGYGGTDGGSKNSNTTFVYSTFLFGDPHVIQDVEMVEENDVINQEAPSSSNNITFTNSLVKERTNTACWIQNPLASLLAFGAPILLIFILNCIFFTRTIINISRTMKLTNDNLYRQHSGHSNSSYSKTRGGRSEAKLYLRMSTVMGFTWVFGFSSAIISSVADRITTTICVVVHAHSILFVIFNISQGLFIFVAFVCNRRVLRLYLGLFFRLKRFLRRQSLKSKIYSISSNSSISSNDTRTSSISQISY